jgi:Rrf2 family protein
MRFTSQIRYAVYALFDMAYHDAGAPHQVKTISRRQAIPPRYLEQIFQRLLRGGILRSKRGPRGGYTLARPPKEITIGEIVRVTEGSVEAVFGGRPAATHARRGGASKSTRRAAGAEVEPRGGEQMWRVVTGQVTGMLDALTLEDLVREAERRGLPREASAANMYFI